VSAQACYPGDPWPYPAPIQPHWPYGPGYYGAGSTSWTPPPPTEERIREIIREEIRAALKELKP
jgi:hypothetical protein